MSQIPPVPTDSQSPFPLQEAPHTTSSGTTSPAGTAEQTIGAARDAIGPLADKAKAFARERPYATAALVGTIALAVINTLRGKRP